MDSTIEQRDTSWNALVADHSSMDKFLRSDQDVAATEGVVCTLGFDRSHLGSVREEDELLSRNSNDKIGKHLVELMGSEGIEDESGESIHDLLSGEIRRLLADGSASLIKTHIDTSNTSHKVENNLREEDALLHSGSTEHAHHFRDTERKEHSAECEVSKSGAPSPASNMSYDFANNSYSLQQLDCQSDFTDSTGGHGQAPFQTNLSNITRRRNRNLSDAPSDLAPSDTANNDDTLSTRSIQGDQSVTMDESEDLDLEQDTEGSGSVDISNIAEASSANHSRLLDLSDAAETMEFSHSSLLGARDTFAASSQVPITSTGHCGEEIDTLVLPTVLSMHARSAVLNAFSEYGAEVKRVNSSTSALVTQFLATQAAQMPLVQNCGYLRILVLEASAGVVSATVVTVESPLQADNPTFNARSHSADPVDTMVADTTVNTPGHISAFRSVSSEDAPGLRASSYVLPESLGRPRTSSGASVLDNTTQVVSAPATPVATPASSSAQSNSEGNGSSNSNGDGYKDSNNTKTSSAQRSWQHLIPEPGHPTVPVARSAVVRAESSAWARYQPSLKEKKPSKAEPLCDFSVTGAARGARRGVGEGDRRVSTAFRNRRDSGGFPGSPGSPEHDYFALYGDEPQHRETLEQIDKEGEKKKEKAEEKELKEVSGEECGSLEDALACCIQVVMAQQAALHSPFNTSNTSTSTSATPPVDARRASYHSLSLDQRLFGLQTAAALHDLESGPRRDAVFQGQTPVPVLDSVLLWGGSKRERGAVVGEELTHEVLLHAQETVQPHLRDPSDHAGLESLQASQLHMEGSFVALTPLSDRFREDARFRAASRASPAVLPLFTLPVGAMWTGACVLQSLTSDLLRVFECYQPVHCDTRTVSSPAVGLVIRPRVMRSGSGDHSHAPVAACEEVIWLYHPICANIGGNGGINTRVDRECSLLLTQAPPPEDQRHSHHDQGPDSTKKVEIAAQECSVNRRSCPLKPSVSVSAFVRRPPPDTACIVQPSSATYAAEVSRSSSEQLSSGGPTEGQGENVVSSEGQLRENLLFSPTPAVDTFPKPSKVPTTAHTSTSTNPLVRLWTLLVGHLHYLIFPGTTFYIQYLQADLRESAEQPAARQTVTVSVSGVQGEAVRGGGDVGVEKKGGREDVGGGGEWEVLVLTQPPLDMASRRNMHIVHSVHVSTAPTFCDELVALEQQCHGGRAAAVGGEEKQGAQPRGFPVCLVSLSAVDNAGVRRFACRVMSPCQAPATTSPDDTSTSASQSRRRKQAQAVQKRHFLALTAPSFELLQFREHQQRRIRAVRTGVKYVLCAVLGAVAVLLLAVLVEVMVTQRQYAMQDVVLPDAPPNITDSTITIIADQREVVQVTAKEVLEVAAEKKTVVDEVPEEVVEEVFGADPEYISLSIEDLPLRRADGSRLEHFFETGRIGDAFRQEELLSLWAQGKAFHADMSPFEPLDEDLVRLEALDNPDPSASPVGPPVGPSDVSTKGVSEPAKEPVLAPELEAVMVSECATAEFVSQSSLSAEETTAPSLIPLADEPSKANTGEIPALLVQQAEEEMAEALMLQQRERLLSLANARDEQRAFDVARAQLAAELAEAEVDVVEVKVEARTATLLGATRDSGDGAEHNHPNSRPLKNAPVSRGLALRESIRRFLRSLQPRFQRCQKQLSEQQHRLYEWTQHTAVRADQALQHSVHVVATSEMVRAASRYAEQAHRAVSEAVHAYAPVVYEALHVDEAKQWLGHRATLVQQDLLYLEEVVHSKPLRMWLQDRTAALHRAADSQRHAAFKSQAELARDAGALLHAAGEGAAHLWQEAQQAAHSASVALCDTYTQVSQGVSRALQTGAQWCADLAAWVVRGVECVKQSAVRTFRFFV